MKSIVTCVKCGCSANKVVEEFNIKIPLCTKHYREYIEEEDGFVDNVEPVLEEEEYYDNDES